MFSTSPILVLESKVTSIFPFSPGLMGARGGVEVVHPHEALAEEMIKGELPELVKVKVCVSFSPCITVPKLKEVFSNLIFGPSVAFWEALSELSDDRGSEISLFSVLAVEGMFMVDDSFFLPHPEMRKENNNAITQYKIFIFLIFK